MTTQHRQLLELNFSVLLLAMIPIVGKFVKVSPPSAILVRAFLTLIALAIIKAGMGADYQVKGNKKWIWIIATGFFMGVHQVLYFYSIQMASASIAMVTLFTYPVFITLSEPLFFKASFKWKNLVLALSVVCGVLLIIPSWDFKNTYSLGIIIGIGSAIFFSLRSIFVKLHLSDVPSITVMFYHHAVIGGGLLVVAGYSALNEAWSWQSLIALMIIGMVLSSIGHTITLKSYQVMNARKVAIISSWQPVLTIIMASLLLGEIPTIRTLIGAIMIIFVVLFESIKLKKTAS